MTWYKTGTVQVTSGSNAVVGTGTAFIANARVGDAFSGPDGNWYEVINIVSNTSLGIYPIYRGASVATGGEYVIAPMEGYVKDSADALRAATQVIGQVGMDVSAQVAAATAAATASQNSATAASTSETNAASSATAANSSKVAAKTSEDNAKVSENNAKTSETNSANSAVASANSAAQAAASAGSVANKASSGANSDITSLSGLTTPLSVTQGGTGRNSGTIVYTGDFGIGGAIGLRLPGDDANITIPNGKYWTPGAWTGSPYPGSDGRNQGYIEQSNWASSSSSVQSWKGISASFGSFVRYKESGAFGAWLPSGSASWGSITGTLSAQADLKVALDAKASTADVPLMPTGATFIRLADASNTTVTLPAGGTWAWWFIRMNSSSGVYSGVNPQVGVSAGGTVISAATAGIYPMGIAWKIS